MDDRHNSLFHMFLAQHISHRHSATNRFKTKFKLKGGEGKNRRKNNQNTKKSVQVPSSVIFALLCTTETVGGHAALDPFGSAVALAALRVCSLRTKAKSFFDV